MSGRFWKFLLIFLVALLVFGVVGVVISFAVRDSGAEFAVEYNGDTYYSNSENQSLHLGSGEHEFTIKFIPNRQADCTVKVVAVADSNFAFSVDGNMYQFYGTDEEYNDYSEVFGLQLTENGFIVSIPENFGVRQVVEQKYGGSVELEQSLQSDLCYFAISVVSGDNIVYLPFTLGSVIIIDPPHVIL